MNDSPLKADLLFADDIGWSYQAVVKTVMESPQMVLAMEGLQLDETEIGEIAPQHGQIIFKNLKGIAQFWMKERRGWPSKIP
jgi:hypothetical protein